MKTGQFPLTRCRPSGFMGAPQGRERPPGDLRPWMHVDNGGDERRVVHMDRDEIILNAHQGDFERINRALEEALDSRVSLIQDIGRHSLLGAGKRLRPLLFVLACRLCGCRRPDIYRLAAIFEYIHTASLLHDDVLDNAEVRRKKDSANRLWGNQAAVLEGDFLYARSFELAVEAASLRFLELLTRTTTRMAEGQILELIHTDDWGMSRERYLEIVRCKTGVLISAACAGGAIIAEAGQGQQEALAFFGTHAGMAFQLMDDLLDYVASAEVLGKPVGKDLREGKITLPLIYALEELGVPERRALEVSFTQRQAKERDYETVIAMVRRSGALDRVREEACGYVEKGAEALQAFPASGLRENLEKLNRYIVERRF